MTLRRSKFSATQRMASSVEASPSAGTRPSASSSACRAAAPAAAPRAYSLRELAGRTGAGIPLVRELVSYGLIREQNGAFDDHALAITRAALALTAHGLEPRHLRPFKAAADRELGLVERAVAPLQARRDANMRPRVARSAQEIAQASLRLHSALVAEGLEQWDDGAVG